MKDDVFASAIAVNLTAPERITAVLLEEGAINPNGRIIGVASIAGIAGNMGQTNYAASKAGVIGFVDALAPDAQGRHHRSTPWRPGFIETKMTAAIPFMTREVGRRLNAMSQGGLPGRRRRDDRLVRQPRLERGQRQRGPGLRPDDAGRLSAGDDHRRLDDAPGAAAADAQGGAAGDPGRRPRCPASGRRPARAARPRAGARGRAGRPGPRGGVRRGVRLPAQGHPAAALPAHAGVPAAHGAADRLVVPVPGDGHWCTWRTPSPSTAPSPRPGAVRRERRARPTCGRTPRAGSSTWLTEVTRRRRAGVGRGLDLPAPRQGRRGAPARACSSQPVDGPGSTGGCRPTSAGATAPCPGDRNPIHLYPSTAKAFGFPRQIAHGMWTKARCVAAIENRLPERSGSRWRSRSRSSCPGTVEFRVEPRATTSCASRLVSPKDGAPHLLGRAR